MKLEERRLVDHVLASEEPCLGAAFCSYTFDPAYFEEHVLRSLLRLRCDPEEDGARYHDEARAALQVTPVACLVDAGARSEGRRLPYDLLLVRARVFHPKVLLVLYPSEARLAIGSGNLTKPGLEQNTELFFVRTLSYADPTHAKLLLGIDAFLGVSSDLAVGGSTQLGLIRGTLQARLSADGAAEIDRMDVHFASSFGGSLLGQFAEQLPADARITRVGVLAPFFEMDDLDAGLDADGMGSVLRDVFALRPSDGAALEIGVPWGNVRLDPSPGSDCLTLEEGIGVLWARRTQLRRENEIAHRLDYFVLRRVTPRRVEADDAAGVRCHFDRAELETEITERKFWLVPQPTVYAPAHILRMLDGERGVRVWLHPSAYLEKSGNPRHRPLHAKALLVTVTDHGRISTYALIGSANASRAALLRGVVDGGNVEAGVICRLDGEIRLRDLLPTLVAYDLEERTFPNALPDLSAWVVDVIHDAAHRTLCVEWATNGPCKLGAWTLSYLGREFARGIGEQAAPTIVSAFELAAASAEVAFASGGHEWQIPIRVADLATLPTNPQLVGLGLRELLALLGRRVGSGRLGLLREQRGMAEISTILDAIFGEGYGPPDVFDAWWGVTEDLAVAPTLAAFRYALIGTTGARAAWTGLVKSAIESDDVQTKDEAWFYGCELLRELERVALPDDADRAFKRAQLLGFCTDLRADLARLSPDLAGRPWAAEIARFYKVGGGYGTT